MRSTRTTHADLYVRSTRWSAHTVTCTTHADLYVRSTRWTAHATPSRDLALGVVQQKEPQKTINPKDSKVHQERQKRNQERRDGWKPLEPSRQDHGTHQKDTTVDATRRYNCIRTRPQHPPRPIRAKSGRRIVRTSFGETLFDGDGIQWTRSRVLSLGQKKESH